ncbi:Cas10/Cmr2 second palm domain-containing protein [Leptolyngbya sp. AN02str]|uniref:Cas10/Cmr2 second palm domain-containing protein n=1 Tax=Leptolyngbya sp. AN02str TaxID=3423363 RepID=UPI003D3146AC
MSSASTSTCYTAISFAPVQGFIEKSRKLRDLYGASLILSYLSQKLVEEFHQPPELKIISPALIHHQKGMPNRILVKGSFIERDRVQNTLLKHWQHLLTVCREWVELYVPADYHWSQRPEQVGKEKGEWERWGSYAWEVFWGSGDSPQAAMEDLETRKLKRDWTAINWTGESSSLSGTDAIAWNRLGEKHSSPGKVLTQAEAEELELFYRRLSWLLDNPEARKGKAGAMSLKALQDYEVSNPQGIGRYIAVNERLSIPELVKRLITYDRIDAERPEQERLKIAKLKKKAEDPEFKDIYREPTYWTGWFMGDGDKVGEKLKMLANRHPDDEEKRDQDLTRFSELVRNWGQKFEDQKGLFPKAKGRVIYAGGDDFMGVLYNEDTETEEKPEKLKPIEIRNWLIQLSDQWRELQAALAEELDFKNRNRFTYSVGFVWAGHNVPQRDVLQHCREAEKRAKSLNRDRVTIRVVFNSGQYIQWTCPWDYINILTKYRDRDGKTGEQANWNHLYSDWATLKARHAIRLREVDSENNPVDRELAVAMLDLYFDDLGQEIGQKRQWAAIAGDNSEVAVVRWINDLVQVGWQLCSNT